MTAKDNLCSVCGRPLKNGICMWETAKSEFSTIADNQTKKYVAEVRQAERQKKSVSPESMK